MYEDARQNSYMFLLLLFIDIGGLRKKMTLGVMTQDNVGFLLEEVLNPGCLLAPCGAVTYKLSLTRGILLYLMMENNHHK